MERSEETTVQSTRRGGFRRLLIRAMLTSVAVLIVAALAALWLLRSEPAYVADSRAFIESKSADELRQIMESLERRIADKLSQPTSFDVTQSAMVDAIAGASSGDIRTISISLDELNALVAVRVQRWLAKQNASLRKKIAEPMVAIDDDTLVLMLRYVSNRFSQLVCLACNMTLEEGREAKMRLESIRGGRLPLPAGTVSKLMTKWQGANKRGPIQRIAQAIEGISFEPIRPIDDDRNAHLIDYKLRDDGLDLIVRIEPRHGKRSRMADARSRLPKSSTGETPLFLQDWFYFWNEIPTELRSKDSGGGGDSGGGTVRFSNIAPQDYVGPEACAKCHRKNYQRWLQHPHRVMNAAATSETVKGRFDGSEIQLRGGRIRMYQEDGQYWIHAKRGQSERLFRVTHTIGSRFLQYYIGVLEKGDPIRVWMDTPSEDRADLDSVADGTKVILPVGYVLGKQQWGPATQVFAHDDTDDSSDPYDGFRPVRYYRRCAHCHTVVPQGYRVLWDMNSTGLKKPAFHYEILPFFQDTLTSMADAPVPEPPMTGRSLKQVMLRVVSSYGPDHAATLGISCEACHYGGKAHVESEGKILPRFFPSSPHIVHSDEVESHGRTRQNINLGCAQCHATPVRKLPGGMRRRNSAEYRDAISGSCYSQLACIDCHEPHTRIGPKWAKTPEQDDASCIRCHDQYDTDAVIQRHTHHRPGSDGARCMNCHMPNTTEGLLDLVRSHQISSPTSRKIIEAGGMNACNLCHLDQSIDWTLDHLNNWYGAKFDPAVLARRYDDMNAPAGQVWLNDSRPEIRLVAIGAAKRAKAYWLTPEVAKQLDDPYVVHRQFAQDTLEHILGTDLKDVGYQYWLTPDERKAVLGDIEQLVGDRSKSLGEFGVNSTENLKGRGKG